MSHSIFMQTVKAASQSLAKHQGFKDSDLKRILEVASVHKEMLLEAWDEFFKSVSGQ